MTAVSPLAPGLVAMPAIAQAAAADAGKTPGNASPSSGGLVGIDRFVLGDTDVLLESA